MEEDGVTFHYQYDELNRLVAVRYPDGRSYRLSYDPAGNLILVAPEGVAVPPSSDTPVHTPVQEREPLKRTVCPRCGTTAQPGGNFCRDCGAALGDRSLSRPAPTPRCPACGRLVKVGAKFCPECGRKLS